MLHNVVITAPGSATLVGEQAIKLGLDGQKLQYVPKSDLVLFHTNLLQPNQSETIYFTAPDKTGDYEFVCTYPGHYMVMRGVIKVVPR
jgi:azurin